MNKYLGKMKLALVAMLAATTVPAFAVSAVDYSAISTSMTAEIGLAITAGLVVAAVVLAPRIGFKIFKSFAK